MKLNKLIIPVACILLAGNASMAQVIMPWENRTETDGDPFAKGETTATKGKLHLEEIIGGRLIQTKGIGAMTWMKDGERYSRMEPNAETGGMDIVAYRAKEQPEGSHHSLFHVYQQRNREANCHPQHLLEHRQREGLNL